MSEQPDYRIEGRIRSSGVELRTFGGVLDQGAVWGPTLADALATLTRMVTADQLCESQQRGVAAGEAIALEARDKEPRP